MITANDRYVAFSSEDGIFSRPLDQPLEGLHRLAGPISIVPSNRARVLQLSQCVSHLLAVSDGNEVVIYNLEVNQARYIIPGVGRTVTSIAWAPHDQNLISVGLLDGSICIWSLLCLGRPITRLMADSRSVCHSLAFCPTRNDVLASLHGLEIVIWFINAPSRPLIRLDLDEDTQWRHAGWNTEDPGKLICLSWHGPIGIWNLSNVINQNVSSFRPRTDSGENEPGHGIESNSAFTTLHTAEGMCALETIGSKGFLALNNAGTEITLHSVENGTLKKLWRCCIDRPAGTLIIRQTLRSIAVLAISQEHADIYVLPMALCDRLGRQRQPLRPPTVSSFRSFTSLHSARRSASSIMTGEIIRPAQFMSPEPIRLQAEQKAVLEKILKQGRRIRENQTAKGRTRVTKDGSPARSHVSMTTMTNSLELPPTGIDAESPMPFLSPNVPAQRDKAWPYTIPPLDERPGHASRSVDSLENIHSSATNGSHDSDSDDETFGSGLRGSGAFMPGGVNVPLPVSCGAIFAPNGQLIVFFPPRIRPPSNARDEEEANRNEKGPKRAARLFPSFGNLIPDLRIRTDSDSEGSDLFELPASLKRPTFKMHPASYPSQQSWMAGDSPIKGGFGSGGQRNKIAVQVRNIEQILPYERDLVGESRILCDMDESGADICRGNSRVCARAGRNESASVWRLLAMILEDKIPSEAFDCVNRDEDLPGMERQGVLASRDGHSAQDTRSRRLSWADHPFGSTWMLERIFAWAEARADCYMLAYMSAIIISADKVRKSHASAVSLLVARKPSYDRAYSFTANGNAQSLVSPKLALSRVDSQSIVIDDSPTKAYQNSRTSSRNTSQPTTPYYESNSSTPPFQFPTVSRTGTKLSFSGSASPELSRGSFGAAARFYAQSITEKLSTYGSSPPLKKLGTSPSSNELSSSLPNAGGSWSKSVSFASSSELPRENSQLSRSYTGREDGYDSDKTVEDVSQPQTPKSRFRDISVVILNQKQFSGEAMLPLMPAQMAAKARSWQMFFVEQLRVWEMPLKAAELEKASGPTTDTQGPETEIDLGLVLEANSQRRRPKCGICFCAIQSLEQLCPSCLHSTHLSCLEMYLEQLDDEQFQCTYGCGCKCDNLGYGPVEWTEPPPHKEPLPTTHAAGTRKASFTDPRRWRARAQGDSW